MTQHPIFVMQTYICRSCKNASH